MKTKNSAVTLSVSCVTYAPDYELLRSVFDELVKSVEKAAISQWRLYLVDNGPDKNAYDVLIGLREYLESEKGIEVTIISGQGNVGYGRGNNLAMSASDAVFHLILNPDVFVDARALSVGIEFLLDDPSVGLICPQALGEQEEVQYIAKRYPSVLILAVRLLMAHTENRYLKPKLDSYEYRDKLPANQPIEVMLASGCFMLAPIDVLKEIQGFDPRFFMYFEDFDLSLRIGKKHRVVHHPDVKIVHLGGGAGRKGLKHIRFFTSSACKFFSKHGWKFFES